MVEQQDLIIDGQAQEEALAQTDDGDSKWFYFSILLIVFIALL